jgi:REP element-mobilizing transposase RayT
MGQSLVKNYVHIIFSTKYREHLISQAIENELYAYLAGICYKLECTPVKVGGHTDHIHILCMLSKKIALMKLLQDVKADSSKWIKTKGEPFKNFFWQDGYGAFSVSPSGVDKLVRYISRQKEHHSKINFENEYRAFLRMYDVEYDEKYLWD